MSPLPTCLSPNSAPSLSWLLCFTLSLQACGAHLPDSLPSSPTPSLLSLPLCSLTSKRSLCVFLSHLAPLTSSWSVFFLSVPSCASLSICCPPSWLCTMCLSFCSHPCRPPVGPCPSGPCLFLGLSSSSLCSLLCPQKPLVSQGDPLTTASLPTPPSTPLPCEFSSASLPASLAPPSLIRLPLRSKLQSSVPSLSSMSSHPQKP